MVGKRQHAHAIEDSTDRLRDVFADEHRQRSIDCLSAFFERVACAVCALRRRFVRLSGLRVFDLEEEERGAVVHDRLHRYPDGDDLRSRYFSFRSHRFQAERGYRFCGGHSD